MIMNASKFQNDEDAENPADRRKRIACRNARKRADGYSMTIRLDARHLFHPEWAVGCGLLHASENGAACGGVYLTNGRRATQCICTVRHCHAFETGWTSIAQGRDTFPTLGCTLGKARANPPELSRHRLARIPSCFDQPAFLGKKTLLSPILPARGARDGCRLPLAQTRHPLHLGLHVRRHGIGGISFPKEKRAWKLPGGSRLFPHFIMEEGSG